ncbi:MAG: response regulator transcription factor [Candidatus Riflebacteria bacterium]|nr:response regulator transcription factor [Candidatus Riflebacteria bacterium]
MEKTTVVLVDDEPLAREGLRTLLLSHPELQVVAECSKFDEIRRYLETNNPEIVFLDIQLFGRNAFDLLPYIPDGTQVIFTTAFDSYAVRAFEINALDYLLKPIKPERFAIAVKRILEKRREEKKELPNTSLENEDGIVLTISGRQKLVKVGMIIAITANGEYSEVHLKESESGLIRKALKSWEENLPRGKFNRIHRNAIINLDYIQKIQKLEDGRFKIFLTGFSQTFETSRRMTAEFEKARENFEIA